VDVVMGTDGALLGAWGLALLVLGAFFLGGVVKGVAGLGLPPIAMGLLVLVLPPASAAAIMVIPVTLTNLWQALRGPALGALVWRLGPMLAALALSTLLLSGWLAASTGALGVVAVGALLVVYAGLALSGLTVAVPTRAEPLLGPLVGLSTGALTAATGIAALPLLPYLQALGLRREPFVQALGLAFSTSSLALALGLSGHMAGMAHWPLLVGAALLGVALGMVLGERLRRRVREARFRRLVLWLLLALGATLMVSAR
jgi:uncharacterized membrane protein YfcA